MSAGNSPWPRMEPPTERPESPPSFKKRNAKRPRSETGFLPSIRLRAASPKPLLRFPVRPPKRPPLDGGTRRTRLIPIPRGPVARWTRLEPFPTRSFGWEGRASSPPTDRTELESGRSPLLRLARSNPGARRRRRLFSHRLPNPRASPWIPEASPNRTSPAAAPFSLVSFSQGAPAPRRLRRTPRRFPRPAPELFPPSEEQRFRTLSLVEEVETMSVGSDGERPPYFRPACRLVPPLENPTRR